MSNKTDVGTQLSQNEANQKKVLAVLAELGAKTVTDDSIKFQGTAIILPESMKGPGGLREAARYIIDYERGQETEFEFATTFPYRPGDGANAFNEALIKVFGSAGLGKSTFDMFGQETKPALISVPTGVHSKVQVPWGTVALPQLEATFQLGATRDKEKGLLFLLSVVAPKKFRTHIEAFFQMVDAELAAHSIYRGKAIDGAEQPNFVDIFTVDKNKVYYSEDTLAQLDANVFSLLEHSQLMRDLKMPLKRAVLLEGPYGTGKTLAGMLAAQTAVNNGWTFILCRPGTDNLQQVLQTAQIYAPALVWYEDIDVVAGAEQGSSMDVSKVLDMLDSVTNKGVEIIAGFTTNHVETIQKGVLRPGRLDAVIHIGDLDRVGFEKLVRVTLEDLLSDDVDFDLVASAYAGFLPAFAVEATRRAVRYNISATKGHPGKITTDDLVNAAIGLRPQLDLMTDAVEGKSVNGLAEEFKKIVNEGAAGLGVAHAEDHGNVVFHLVPGE